MAKSGENSNQGMSAFAAILLAVVAIVAIIAVSWQAHQQTQTTTVNGQTLNSLSISAEGYATAKPQMAVVDLFINATGNTTGAATANLSKNIALLNSTLYNYVNGNTSLIKTSYYSVSKVVNYPTAIPCVCSQQESINATAPVCHGCVGQEEPSNGTNASRYVAQEYMEVTLPQLSRLDSMLVSVSNVPSLYVEDAEATLAPSQVASLKDVAISQALQNATEQAGPIIGNSTIVYRNVSIENYYQIPYVLASSVAATPASLTSQPGTLFYNGTTTVSASVYVVYYYR